MEEFHTDDSAKADRELNEAMDKPEVNESSNNDADTKFVSRAEDYRLESLDRADPREACIGAVNAGLTKIIHYTEKSIERAIETGSANLLEEPQLGRAISAYSGLIRQHAQLTNLETRISEGQSHEQSLFAKRMTDPLRARTSQLRPR
jgi:hypothetical protein